MLDRVFGRPKEQLVVERAENALQEKLRSLTVEQLEALAQRRHLRRVDDAAAEAGG